jgi:hypothetical protein
MNKKVVLSLWGLILFNKLYPQIEINNNNELPQEIIAPSTIDDIDVKHQTIYINQFSEEELLETGFFNHLQSELIVFHRIEFGHFISPQELVQCKVTIDQINSIYKWLRFEKSISNQIKNIYKPDDPKSTFSGRIKPATFEKPNDAQSDYLGFEMKAKITYNKNIQLGFSLENDVYEKPLDFYSCYLHLKDLHPLKSLILGKYIVQWNRGFTLGSSGQFGSPISLENWTNQLVGIKPYASYSEDLGHWGAAAHISKNNHDFYFGTGFIPFDCTLNWQENAFSQRQFGGYHQTQNQVTRKHNNTEFQSFFGWQKTTSKAIFNTLITHYNYLIPKINTTDSKVQNDKFLYFEGQLTVPNFIGGRWLFNFSFDQNYKKTCISTAGVWALNKQLDFGARIQTIPNEFSAPEMSYQLKSTANETIFEMGIDYQLNKRNQFKIRAQAIQFNTPIFNQEINENPIKNIVIFNHSFSKTDILNIQFKRETEFYNAKGYLYQLQCNQTIKVNLTNTFHLGFIQKWNNSSSVKNYLFQVGLNSKLGKRLNVSAEQNWFFCPSTNIYNLDNSLPGGLGYMVYSNIGTYFNAILKVRLISKMWLNIKLQKMQKIDVKNMSTIDTKASYHRIFVQITFQ